MLLLTVEGAAVRPKPAFPSLVWDESPSVPSWFWVSVEDSVEVPTLKLDPSSVPETLVELPAVAVKAGGEETDTSDWSVLGSVTLRGGVESEVSSAVDMC